MLNSDSNDLKSEKPTVIFSLLQKELLSKRLIESVQKLYGDRFTENELNQFLLRSNFIDKPANVDHGDWTTSLAMILFSEYKDRLDCRSPRELATQLLEAFPKQNEIAKVEIAGPGFINFTISDKVFSDATKYLRNESALSIIPKPLKGKKGIVEFTDPNPFKEFHIGHLYSNVVGEAVGRLLDTTGADVKRFCYQGDVGMHVAKSIWGWIQLMDQKSVSLEYMRKWDLQRKVQFLGKAYAYGATEYKENESVQQQIKEINVLTFKASQERMIAEEGWQGQVNYDELLPVEQNFDIKQILELYTTGRAWSLEYFEFMYRSIGMNERQNNENVTFNDYFFESLVGEYGLQIVREYLSKGVFEKSDGAIIFPGEKYGLHNRVFVNSLGLPTYEAKELGLAIEKYSRWPYDFSIIMTGNEIDEYFKVLLLALSKIRPDLAAKTQHISHGMVRLPEGKMSSRTGKIVTGESLLETVRKAALEQIIATGTVDKTQQNFVAIAVAKAAIKYAFLRSSIGKDITFNVQEEIQFQGDTGPYLQYSVVRCISVINKILMVSTEKQYSAYAADEMERQLQRKLAQFDSIVVAARQTNFLASTANSNSNESNVGDVNPSEQVKPSPHVVAKYLHELAQMFNTFYSEHKIVEESPKEVRIELVYAVKNVLAAGMSLLGLPIVEQM